MEAALRDIAAQRPRAIYCLGDIVGYGASPREVIRMTREHCLAALQGNHDAALLDERDARGFNERALKALDWTRRAMDPEVEENGGLWDWLGGLVPAMELDPGDGAEAVQLVHASPRDPVAEYLLPSLQPDHEKLRANFEVAAHRLTFFGHTHHPGYFPEGGAFERAAGAEFRLRLEPGRRYLINVGSVGQPRDGDPRLAYLLLDGDEARWRRVEYDVLGASRRIESAADLPGSLAARLLVGR
ncbi:MAG: metallophosphoesterase [Planctomycetota bacterium]|nr:MAG: metallophosphoesterase [Planctomycetota bacterium]